MIDFLLGCGVGMLVIFAAVLILISRACPEEEPWTSSD